MDKKKTPFAAAKKLEILTLHNLYRGISLAVNVRKTAVYQDGSKFKIPSIFIDVQRRG